MYITTYLPIPQGLLRLRIKRKTFSDSNANPFSLVTSGACVRLILGSKIQKCHVLALPSPPLPQLYSSPGHTDTHTHTHTHTSKWQPHKMVKEGLSPPSSSSPGLFHPQIIHPPKKKILFRRKEGLTQ
jgi:hypothetical protein